MRLKLQKIKKGDSDQEPPLTNKIKEIYYKTFIDAFKQNLTRRDRVNYCYKSFVC